MSDPYSLTIMFINACHIYYKESSEDPIFPAKGQFDDMWTNLDSRARPLACVDWIDACFDDGDCRPPYTKDLDLDERFVFMRYALNKSTAFHSIEFQGASGLDAQSKIQDYESLPLSKDPPQWMLESWKLFNTSLARIQYDALDIANGTNSDREPLYSPGMDSTWMHGKLCHKFVFQVPKGYDNIRILPVIFLLLIPFALWQLAIERKSNGNSSEGTDSDEGIPANREAPAGQDMDFSEKQKNSICFEGLKPIRAEEICWNIAAWCSKRFSRSKDKRSRRSEQVSDDAEVGEQGEAGPLLPQSRPSYGTEQNLPGKTAAASGKPGVKPDPNLFRLTSPASTPSEPDPASPLTAIAKPSQRDSNTVVGNPEASSSKTKPNVKPEMSDSEGRATTLKSSNHAASDPSSDP